MRRLLLLLLLLLLQLPACAPAPAVASRSCSPLSRTCELRYAIWPGAPELAQASILPAVAAIDPTNPEATTDSELLADAVEAFKAGHWALLGAVLAFWGWLALRKLAGGDFGKLLHTHWGTIGGGILAGLLAQVVVTLSAAFLKGTPVTWGIVWAGLISGAGTILMTYLRDAMPSPAAQAAKA